ncbi:MAG: hypothetical protein K2G03_04595, partial [Bacilli bacterium]|nr:hypothetical protein [Bacilli bacterium]
GILIVKGEMGMGKTHSLAYQVHNCINLYEIPAIIIQASSIYYGDTWKQILERSFGLPSTFSLNDLWQIIDSITWLYKKHNNNSKFLICIDGIDESQPYFKWQQIIDDALLISKKNNRIKFCFSGRHYAFKELNISNKMIKSVYATMSYGKMQHEMIRKYFDSYNVKTQSIEFFYEVLKDPLMVKLFCELHKNETVSNLTTDITLTKLIKKNLENLDNDFIKRNDSDSAYQGLIWNSCNEVSKYFETSKCITHRDLLSLLFSGEYSEFSYEIKCKVIKSLSDYGILFETEKKTSEIEPPKKIYYVGMQPIMEFLRANSVAHKIMDDEIKNVKIKLNHLIGGLFTVLEG